MDAVRVLLVDDHTLFRRGVAAVLASQEKLVVVGEAADGFEGIQKARETRPDVVVMDLIMPKCGGLEATAALQTEVPEANILILTVSDKESDLFAAIKAGARGYLLKNSEPDELLRAIFLIAKGGVIVSPAMATKLLGEFTVAAAEEPPPEATDKLSKREEEVLQLVARGATNKEIASTLFISENTVKTHLGNIMTKLHLANRSQAAVYAVKAGIHRHET